MHTVLLGLNDVGMVRMPVYGAGCHLIVVRRTGGQNQLKLMDGTSHNLHLLSVAAIQRDTFQ